MAGIGFCLLYLLLGLCASTCPAHGAQIFVEGMGIGGQEMMYESHAFAVLG